jgi:hypothetical protein
MAVEVRFDSPAAEINEDRSDRAFDERRVLTITDDVANERVIVFLTDEQWRDLADIVAIALQHIAKRD